MKALADEGYSVDAVELMPEPSVGVLCGQESESVGLKQDFTLQSLHMGLIRANSQQIPLYQIADAGAGVCKEEIDLMPELSGHDAAPLEK